MSSVFHHASVSPSRGAGFLLLLPDDAVLVFPQSPSARSAQHLSDALTGYAFSLSDYRIASTTPVDI